MVVDAHTGDVLYERNADIRFVPASNRKLFSTAAGLIDLGPETRFHTLVLAETPISADGSISGNIYVRGQGESTLTDVDLDSIANALKAHGLRHVAGDIVGDGSFFPDDLYGDNWGWNNLTDASAPQISGLEVNRDVILVRVTGAGQLGTAPVVVLVPSIPYATVINNGATTDKPALQSNATVYNALNQIDRVWDGNVILVRGPFREKESVSDRIPLVDPPRYAALEFERACERQGITVGGVAISGATSPTATVVLADHEGPTLSEYVTLTNKPSDNLLAETLVRQMGYSDSKQAIYGAGHDAEIRVLRRVGVDTSTMRLRDGSGVSRRDFVTPKNVIQLLKAMTVQPVWPIWYKSLPIAGVDGSLRNRFKGTSSEGNVHAKTGSLSEVCCLSGYAITKSGRMLAFTILTNNFLCPTSEVRNLHNKLVETLTDMP